MVRTFFLSFFSRALCRFPCSFPAEEEKNQHTHNFFFLRDFFRRALRNDRRGMIEIIFGSAMLRGKRGREKTRREEKKRGVRKSVEKERAKKKKTSTDLEKKIQK